MRLGESSVPGPRSEYRHGSGDAPLLCSVVLVELRWVLSPLDVDFLCCCLFSEAVMRMRREKRWESTLRTAKQGIGVGCAHDHYYASPAPPEMKGVGTGRGAPSSFPHGAGLMWGPGDRLEVSRTPGPMSCRNSCSVMTLHVGAEPWAVCLRASPGREH